MTSPTHSPRLRLEALDLPLATAAARAGLLASPWDQRLHADLMQIAGAAGNPAGVKAIWNELLSRFDDEDQIRPDVAAVYNRCRNGQNVQPDHHLAFRTK